MRLAIKIKKVVSQGGSCEDDDGGDGDDGNGETEKCSWSHNLRSFRQHLLASMAFSLWCS